MLFNGLDFIPMQKEDIPILTQIMKRAFDDDANTFTQNPEDGPVGYDDGSYLQKWGFESNAIPYRINLNGKAIGAIILFIDTVKKLGVLDSLFIDAGLIGKGYGHIAWLFAEHTYPQIKTWETATPAISYRNHYFYINKCGFQVYAVEGGPNRYEAQFKLRKILP